MAENHEPIEVVNETTGEIVEIKTPHKLVAETRDLLLRHRRSQRLGETWDKLSENDQQNEINSMEYFAFELVNKIVEVVGEAGCVQVVTATLDKYGVKDGVTTISAKGRATDQAVLALNRIGKKMLKIVVLDADRFDEERPVIEPDADQPDLLEKPEDDEQLNDDDDLHEEKSTLMSDEYHEGFKAYEDGAPDSSNPYGEDETKAPEWDAGWDAAQLKAALKNDGEITDNTEVEEPDEEAPAVETPPTEDENVVEEKPEPVEEVEQEPVKDSPIDAEAYQTGREMCVNEHAPEENPHDPDTDAHNSWAKGWNDMHEIRRASINEGKEAKDGGKGPHHNPYDEGTPEHGFWDKGYNL